MLGRYICALGLIAAAMLPLSDARAERRVALVVGNSEYSHAPGLRNPRNDAADMAEALKKLGFKVLLGLDLDQRNFARNIDEFGRLLDEADVGLFYYAGHGLQLNEKNHLVSTNAQLNSEFLIPSETIELDAIVRLMESKTAVNLIFLDACRNNPLVEDLRRNLTALRRNALIGRGLARIEPSGRDTLIAFAAAPGQEVVDGAARNSAFTGALLNQIAKPGQEVSVMLKEVAAEVRRETRSAQRPQQLSDMTRTFYFAQAEQVTAAESNPAPEPRKAEPASPPQAALPPVEDRALDMAFWNAAQAANECDAIKAYLKRFPNGIFVDLARIAERRLCVAQVAATPSASAPAATPAPPLAPAAAPPPPAPAATPAFSPAIASGGAAPAPSGRPSLGPLNRAAPPSAAPAALPPLAASRPGGGPSATVNAVTTAPAPRGIPAPPVASPSPAETSVAPRQAPPAAVPTVAIASANPSAAPEPPPAADAPASAPDVDLVRSIQAELLRVGCAKGEPDGRWSEAMETAVRRFNYDARWNFEPPVPSPSLMAALQRSDANACLPECQQGFEPRGKFCVAVVPEDSGSPVANAPDDSPPPAKTTTVRAPEKKKKKKR